MSPRETLRLRDFIGADVSRRAISDARNAVSIADLAAGSCLGSRIAELSGRSILIAMTDQLRTAIAMIELDGEQHLLPFGRRFPNSINRSRTFRSSGSKLSHALLAPWRMR